MFYKRIAFIAVIFSMLGISMAFAALSSNLTINGLAVVEVEGWDIHFENLQTATLTGSATELSAPVLNPLSVSITGFDVNFANNGDSISYQFDVVNDGTIDASIGTISFTTPVCVGSGIDALVDENLVCSSIDYSLTHVGGLLDGQEVLEFDDLLSGQFKTFELTLSYNNVDIPASKVELTNLGLTLIYTQN